MAIVTNCCCLRQFGLDSENVLTVEFLSAIMPVTLACETEANDDTLTSLEKLTGMQCQSDDSCKRLFFCNHQFLFKHNVIINHMEDQDDTH